MDIIADNRSYEVAKETLKNRGTELAKRDVSPTSLPNINEQTCPGVVDEPIMVVG